MVISRSLQTIGRVFKSFTRKALRIVNAMESKVADNVDDRKRGLFGDTDAGDAAKRVKREVNETDDSEKTPIKWKIKKWVLLLSYCGHGYYGMQMQNWDSPLPTIEQELLRSLWKCGVIKEEHFKAPHTLRFQRAARTDKGVSAVRQIVSLNLPTHFPEFVPKINELLPNQIRVIAGKRVTKFFDAKNFCDGRSYSYLMPSFALCPIDELCNKSYRLSNEVLSNFNEILDIYRGTHNYHNFTAGKTFNDPSAVRYIVEMRCSEPFNYDDMEFVVVRVRGQSFMLHQIRKMMGLAIAIMRGIASRETTNKAFAAQRIDIPIAPGLGLLLEEVHYDRYNQKYSGDGFHEAIQWDEHNHTINDFRQNYVYSNIFETEKADNSMFHWLQTLPLHTYDVREHNIRSDDVNDSNDHKLTKLVSMALRLKKIDDKNNVDSSVAIESNSEKDKLNDENDIKISCIKERHDEEKEDNNVKLEPNVD